MSTQVITTVEIPMERLEELLKYKALATRLAEALESEAACTDNECPGWHANGQPCCTRCIALAAAREAGVLK